MYSTNVLFLEGITQSNQETGFFTLIIVFKIRKFRREIRFLCNIAVRFLVFDKNMGLKPTGNRTGGFPNLNGVSEM